MELISREEAIDLLDNLKGMIEDSQGNDYDEAIKVAIYDMQKLEKIEQFIKDYDGAIIISENMGIISGQTLIDELKQIVKES